MSRIARVVVPGLPHHITQRGNRRMRTFFCDDDNRRYVESIVAGVKIKAHPHFRLVTTMNAVGRNLAVVVDQGVKENKFQG